MCGVRFLLFLTVFEGNLGYESTDDSWESSDAENTYEEEDTELHDSSESYSSMFDSCRLQIPAAGMITLLVIPERITKQQKIAKHRT
jgi:hypothetical protein